MKTIESRIAPNPKEAQIWVDLSADAHGLVKKYWNGKTWVVKENNVIKTENVIDELKPTFNKINDALEEIKANLDFLNTYHDEYLLKMIKALENRIAELEELIITE